METKANNLIELVGYQNGSVVSKALINKPAGTVTLFSFDKGEGLSEHKAPFDVMVMVIDGEAEVEIDGIAKRVKKDEMFIMPANHPYFLKAIASFKMLLIMIKDNL